MVSAWVEDSFEAVWRTFYRAAFLRLGTARYPGLPESVITSLTDWPRFRDEIMHRITPDDSKQEIAQSIRAAFEALLDSLATHPLAYWWPFSETWAFHPEIEEA